MKQILRNKAYKRWAKTMMDVGLQVAIEAAMAREEPFNGAMGFFKRLEDAHVIRPWIFEAEVTLTGPYAGTTDFFEVMSIPDDMDERDDASDLPPLYIAGEHWDAFVAECASL
jgi:hypothetical protein